MAAPASSVYIGWLGPIQFQSDAAGIIFPGTVTATRFLGDDGTAALPTFSFSGTGDGDNGMYLSAADTLGWSAGGTLRLSLSSTALTSTVPTLGPNGAVGGPTFAFANSTNSGMYWTGTSLAFSREGVLEAQFSGGNFDLVRDASTLRFGASADVVLSRPVANLLQLAQDDNFSLVRGYVQGFEQTAPAAPAADGYRLFAQDNGGGKTQLMVLFSSGAAQQVAIQP